MKKKFAKKNQDFISFCNSSTFWILATQPKLKNQETLSSFFAKCFYNFLKQGCNTKPTLKIQNKNCNQNSIRAGRNLKSFPFKWQMSHFPKWDIYNNKEPFSLKYSTRYSATLFERAGKGEKYGCGGGTAESIFFLRCLRPESQRAMAEKFCLLFFEWKSKSPKENLTKYTILKIKNKWNYEECVINLI